MRIASAQPSHLTPQPLLSPQGLAQLLNVQPCPRAEDLPLRTAFLLTPKQRRGTSEPIDPSEYAAATLRDLTSRMRRKELQYIELIKRSKKLPASIEEVLNSLCIDYGKLLHIGHRAFVKSPAFEELLKAVGAYRAHLIKRVDPADVSEIEDKVLSHACGLRGRMQQVAASSLFWPPKPEDSLLRPHSDPSQAPRNEEAAASHKEPGDFLKESSFSFKESSSSFKEASLRLPLAGVVPEERVNPPPPDAPNVAPVAAAGAKRAEEAKRLHDPAPPLSGWRTWQPSLPGKQQV